MLPPKTSDIVLESVQRCLRDRLDRETTIIGGLHFFVEVLEEVKSIDSIMGLMADEMSRRTLTWLISFRIAHYLTGSRDEAERLFPPIITRNEHDAMKRAIEHLPERDLEENFDFDLIENYVLDGYSLSGVCEVLPGDIVLDFGAHNGNSGIVFSRKTGPSGRIFGFEPHPHTRECLQRNLKKMEIDNFEIVPLGVGERRDTLNFHFDGPASRVVSGGGASIDVVTIDEFVAERGLSTVNFMKFDIEGQEAPAVRGAAQTIVRYRPKLAIAIYHLHWDLRKIVGFINGISPWYKFYLRHNAMQDSEVLLFCAPLTRLPRAIV